MFSFFKRKPKAPKTCLVEKNGDYLSWIIGKEISEEDYNNFKDQDGIICIGSYWEAGEERSFLMKRDAYEEMQAQVRSGAPPSDSQKIDTIEKLTALTGMSEKDIAEFLRRRALHDFSPLLTALDRLADHPLLKDYGAQSGWIIEEIDVLTSRVSVYAWLRYESEKVVGWRAAIVKDLVSSQDGLFIHLNMPGPHMWHVSKQGDLNAKLPPYFVRMIELNSSIGRS